MTTLKNKIKVIPPLPNKKKNKISIKIIIFITLSLTTLILFLIYIGYNHIIPYINAVNINKVTGKKITYTDCNTKDYIIINKDKSYSMQLTNKECKINNYEGNVIIKNNEIYFKYNEIIHNNNSITKNIKGIIDTNNYNIIINDNTFESDLNE